MSPLVWDLAHIAAYEDLWLVHRLRRRCRCCGPSWPRCTTRSRRRAPCAATCRCSTARGALDYLDDVRERALDVLDGDAPATRRCRAGPSATSTQHGETMLQTIELAPLLGARPVPRAGPPRCSRRSHRARERPDPGRPVHDRRARRPSSPTTTSARGTTPTCRSFRIGRTPITNATYLTFVEGGGYRRRPWWTRRGAGRGRSSYDITHPGAWAGGPGRVAAVAHRRRGRRSCSTGPSRPRLLVRGGRVRAFPRPPQPARPKPSGRRRPRWTPETRVQRAATEWGDLPQPTEDRHAQPRSQADVRSRLGRGAFCPAVALLSAVTRMLGDVWEWTSERVQPLRRLQRPSPYREYSEVHFGKGLQGAARRGVGDAALVARRRSAIGTSRSAVRSSRG